MTKSKNAFKSKFKPFVMEGDKISLSWNGYDVAARIHRDDSSDAPDERQDGFWPSLDKNDMGYIGPGKTVQDLFNETQKMKRIMRAWKNDEWFYVGVVLEIERDDEKLTGTNFQFALWGIECNYPSSDQNKNPNDYLTDVANELFEEFKSVMTTEKTKETETAI